MTRSSRVSDEHGEGGVALLIVGVAFSVIGTLALAICGFFIVTGWQAAWTQTATTSGTITAVRPVDGDDHNDGACTLRYDYEVDGRHYDSRTRSGNSWACSRFEGETVEVHYDPQHPWQGSILVDQTGLWVLTLAGTVGPLAFLGTGVGSLIGWTRYVRRVSGESLPAAATTPESIEPSGPVREPQIEPGADGWPLLESPRPEQH